MNTAANTGVLSPEEWQLVSVLRDLPPSQMRDRFFALLGELLQFVAEPACAEMQADGVPCASSRVACDQCKKVTEILDALRARLHQA